MNTILSRLRDAAHKRALYHRTVVEIERMPHHMALDLDIFPGDARRIAQQAVYGR